MRIDGLRCDQCSKEYHPSSMTVGTLPDGWFALTKGSSGLVHHDKHFCSLECLISWASSQIVNASKVDTGGPVVAFSKDSQ